MKTNEIKEPLDLDIELGRSEILDIVVADNPLPLLLHPDAPSPAFTIDAQSSRLEELSVRALMDIINSGGKSSDRLKAVDISLKAIGKSGQGSNSANIGNAKNVQINNITQNPDLLAKLQQAGSGLEAVSNGTIAELITINAGKGI